MPSTYAHYRFGREVAQSLSPQNKSIVQTYPELYAIGLHGPDLFFYYQPLISNALGKFGGELHSKSGRSFFEEMSLPLVRTGYANRAATSYLYGFLCHFALDSTCHGLINQKSSEMGISHAEIESEFDRLLMTCDGLPPVSHPLTEHIHPTLANASVISRFFTGVSAHQIQKCLRRMVGYHKLLLAPQPVKRKSLEWGMRIIGRYDDLSGMMISLSPNPLCEEICVELESLYQKAVPVAVRLIEGFKDGNLSDQAYDLNFESVIPR